MPLVLSDRALAGRELPRDAKLIQVANRAFGLGVDHPALQQLEEILTATAVLCHTTHLGTHDLIYLAIAKKLSKAEMRELDEFGAKDTRDDVRIWRKFGHPDIADLLDEFYDLSDIADIQIIRESGAAWPEIANKSELEDRIDRISARLRPLEASAIHCRDEMEAAVCRQYGLELRPREAFNQYWVDRITKAPGFLSYEPEPEGTSWSLANAPLGWLTKRHGAALERHGYRYRFAFWQDEIGDTRGHLWIQTDKGPLRLTDHTDSASQRSIFPVPVFTVAGAPLFELTESDVPEHLMRDGPKIPRDLSARASKSVVQQRGSETFWNRIVRWLRGK